MEQLCLETRRNEYLFHFVENRWNFYGKFHLIISRTDFSYFKILRNDDESLPVARLNSLKAVTNYLNIAYFIAITHAGSARSAGCAIR